MVPRRRRLPDLCVIVLLQMMSTRDQLRAGRMNSRWTVLLRAAKRRVRSLKNYFSKQNESSYENLQLMINLLSLGGNSRSLPMLTTEDGKALYPITGRLTQWNCLKVKETNEFTVSEIANAFSAITELTYASELPADFEQLVELLNQHPFLSRQLTSFTLIDNYWEEQAGLSSVLNNRLFAAINNGMPVLERLAIKLENGLKIVDDMPVIAQLKLLCADCTKANIATLLTSLNRYAEDAVDLQVILKRNSDMLEQLSEDNRIRIVCFFNCVPVDENLLAICNSFSSLASIHLLSLGRNLAENFVALSHLNQLVHLFLSFHLFSSFYFSLFNESIRPVAVLRSVRALDLKLNISSHRKVSWLNLERTLPNLEAIHLKSLTCYKCNIVLKDFHEYEGEKFITALKCLRTILPQLHSRGCLPLSRILLDLSSYHTAEEVCIAHCATPPKKSNHLTNK